MQAIVEEEHGPADLLTVQDLPRPLPGPGQLLIQVAAAGVNQADLVQRRGFYPPPPGASSIYGLEVSGRVIEIGEGAEPTLLGQERVALLAGGGYAQYVTVEADQTLPLPAGMDCVTAGGLVEVAATLYSNFQALGISFDPALNTGKSLLVQGGSGGIGNQAISWGRLLGLEVFATCSSQDKCDYVASLGARPINYRQQNFRQVIREETAGRGVDFILDTVGGPYLEDNIKSLALEGSLVVIGLQGGPKGTLNLGYMLPRRLTVQATSLRNRPLAHKAQILAGLERDIWPFYASGQLDVRVDSSFPLAQAAQAHRRMEAGEHRGKILLLPEQEGTAC